MIIVARVVRLLIPTNNFYINIEVSQLIIQCHFKGSDLEDSNLTIGNILKLQHHKYEWCAR